MRRYRVFLVSVLSIFISLFASRLPAPIYGIFPGAEEVVERADEILVIQILSGSAEHVATRESSVPYDPTNGTISGPEGGVYEVKVLQAIKGERITGTTDTLRLVIPGPTSGSPEIRFHFIRGSVHIVALEDGRAMNAQGAWFELDPQTRLNGQPDDDPVERVTRLLKESERTVRKRLEMQEAQRRLWAGEAR